MSLSAWFKHPVVEFRKWRDRKRKRSASEEIRNNLPLREFVYLDAVSLHSLLVSQNATIPTEVSQAISRADEAELTGATTTKLGSELVGASAQAETTARYQTSNSNSMQSSRKAVIQTLFKELRELPLEFKLASRAEQPERLTSAAEISTKSERNAVQPSAEFARGTLIEVEVTLAVDPVFKLGSMMTEWNSMADDFPAMFGGQGLLGFLRDSQPIMKVLDRFLAGLIPIKAAATNYVVAEVDGKEYVVHKTAIEGLEIETRPLHIVGVTEHIGYWKDIRRVLFSEARFTILCRVARDGIQTKWTPVKLADLFSEVAPDFVDSINAIRSPTAADADGMTHQTQQTALAEALEFYRDALTPEGFKWTADAEKSFRSLCVRISSGAVDAVAQRHAFDQVREAVTQMMAIEAPDPDYDLKARQQARSRSGLELFPTNGIDLSGSAPSAAADPPDERMLDTEVIAIYW